jgi:hypothetical protein
MRRESTSLEEFDMLLKKIINQFHIISHLEYYHHHHQPINALTAGHRPTLCITHKKIGS